MELATGQRLASFFKFSVKAFAHVRKPKHRDVDAYKVFTVDRVALLWERRRKHQLRRKEADSNKARRDQLSPFRYTGEVLTRFRAKMTCEV